MWLNFIEAKLNSTELGSGLLPLQYVTYGAALRELQGSLCVLLLALGYIVALPADHSRPDFTFLRIIVNSCWLPLSLPLAYMLLLLASCLYVTQTTALELVFPGEVSTLTMGANPKVPISSANDVGSSLHPASVPDVPSPGFFGLRGRGL